MYKEKREIANRLFQQKCNIHLLFPYAFLRVTACLSFNLSALANEALVSAIAQHPTCLVTELGY